MVVRMRNDLIPNYCEEDGAQITVSEDGLAIRGECPECGERWYGTIVSSLLYRLPAQIRNPVGTGLRVFFDREKVTPAAAFWRMLLHMALIFAGTTLLGVDGPIPVIIAIGVFFGGMSTSMLLAEPGDGSVTSGVDWALLILAGASGWIAWSERLMEGLATIDTRGLGGAAIHWVPVIVAFCVGVIIVEQIGIRIHERLHKVAFDLLGQDCRIKYNQGSYGPVTALVGGSVTPQPTSWRGKEWKMAAISFAPALMLIPLVVIILAVPEGTLDSLPDIAAGLLVGCLGGWGLCALPSGSDLNLAFGTGWYRQVHQAEKAETHRTAEGI